MDGGETKKSAPSYFVIKVNDDGTITQTRQQGTLTTKPHIIRTPEKRTKDGRTIYIEQKDNLGSSTIKIHEPVGTSEASMMSNILVEAEPTGKSTRPTIQSKGFIFELVKNSGIMSCYFFSDSKAGDSCKKVAGLAKNQRSLKIGSRKAWK